MAENGSERTNSTALIRTIGRWSLTALVINSIIGSGIFGLPSVVSGRVGRMAPTEDVITYPIELQHLQEAVGEDRT